MEVCFLSAKGRVVSDFLIHKVISQEQGPPVPKLCQNAMFFVPLGLALSEKQIPQITENTGKSKQLMQLLESDSARPRH